MLKALFDSEPRVKILNLLLLHPENEYSSRQMAQNLDLPSTAVLREINNLQKTQLIAEREMEIPTTKKIPVKTRVFSINRDFILYPEIRALFIKGQILSSQKFITTLLKTGQLKLLLLTGLFTNDLSAPTDLLVVGRVKRDAFLKSIKSLEKDLGREINFTILSEIEFNYRQGMMDIFLYTVLEGKNLILLDEIGLKDKKGENKNVSNY